LPNKVSKGFVLGQSGEGYPVQLPRRHEVSGHGSTPPTTPGYVPWPTDGDEWRTPDHLFRFLDRLFHFTVDVAATAQNRKVRKFFDRTRDGLKQNWAKEVVFVNPPYSEAAKWTAKAQEAARHGATVVALLPNRSASKWYRQHVVPSAQIVLLYGRIPFYRRETGQPDIAMSGAPFASILAIWPTSAGMRILKFTQPTSTVMMAMPPID